MRWVAFVNEEPPYFQTENMGSRVYAKGAKAKNENITAMISIETIGHYSDEPNSQLYPLGFNWFYPNTDNFIGFVGNISSRSLVRQTIKTFRDTTAFPSEGVAVPGWFTGVGWSDHWSFWQAGYPAIMVTDTVLFRYRPYHTSADKPDKIDYAKMARAVAGLVNVVAELANEN